MDARTLAAGTGVTTALVIAAVVAFVAITAFVAFEGIPFASGGSPESSVNLSTGPQAAALTAGSEVAASVAAEPTAPSAAAAAEIVAALPGAGRDAPGGRGSGPGGSQTGGTDTGPGAGGGGTGIGPDGGGPTVVPGPLQGTVGAVQDTAGGLGLNLPLPEVTDDITKPIDDIVGGVGNGLGAGNLGGRANNTVGGLLP